ncbi:FliM/FliN family flagellar motor C-terminal domain-containing protein [Gemmobacter sp. LW-1]|uniref:FliM/FliN family flagellar motor C-terminal domain-containing protein n=1 Tax=Gemmobacter sp. LW-1 TaxID=1529005 RepID=UPI0006C77038|nr:FliM/FliN family flagellar motor C-terminal domain-containing protein [Gemmobacter sp. LW-1]
MDQGVIRRKLAGAQAARLPDGGVERALPLALARAARERLGCDLTVSGLAAHRFSLAELLEQPPDLALIAILEGPREATGVMVLDSGLLAALIEVQTLGHVAPQSAAPRRPTRTDAAMVADWVDAALAALEEALLTEEDLVWTDGFRYASYLDEPRPLALMLEDAPFKVLTCDLRFAAGREGRVILALPAEGHGRRPQRKTPLPAPDPMEGPGFTAALADRLAEAEAVVEAVLCRVTLPLNEVLRLAPGGVLPLPGAQIDQIRLEGGNGQVAGQGRLGQNRGMRAVRLTALSEGGAAPLAASLPQESAASILPLTGTG